MLTGQPASAHWLPVPSKGRNGDKFRQAERLGEVIMTICFEIVCQSGLAGWDSL